MPKTTDVRKQCTRCHIYQPETWFRSYIYKGEMKRRKHCKYCVVGKGEQLPTETLIERWLKNTVKS